MREIAKELVFPDFEKNEFYLLVDDAKRPVIDHYPSVSEPFLSKGKLIIYYEE